MEDISRELEKEIAQSRPKPYKKSQATRILIVDDFGTMKSGEYLKTLVRIFSITSVVLLLTTAVFWTLYINVSKSASERKSKLDEVQARLESVTKDKEVLMARLVILGEQPTLISSQAEETESAGKDRDTPTIKTDLKTQSKSRLIPADAEPVENVQGEAVASENQISDKETGQSVSGQPGADSTPIAEDSEVTNGDDKDIKAVAVEKFKVIKDGNNGDLLVRFDIRNVSKGQGDVSGRIFTVLKPENGSENQWLVVPASPLEDGVPSEYRKGQYFSIAHFKPVKFRIKSSAPPDFFKMAAIYIFNSSGEIIAEQIIEISEE